MKSRALGTLTLSLGLAILLACSNPGRVVQHELRIEAASPVLLQRVAVAPFASVQPDGDAAVVSGLQVAGFVADALAEHGMDVIPPSDLVTSPVGADEIAATALAVAQHFGASALLVGELSHFREPGASRDGGFSPAQIRFDVTLYEAPRGELVWRASFHYTQQSFTANPLAAIRYPGRGFRWISASELARWGAGEVARALRRTEGLSE